MNVSEFLERSIFLSKVRLSKASSGIDFKEFLERFKTTVFVGIPAGTCSMPTHLTSVRFDFLPNGVQTHFLGHGTLSQDTKSHMYRSTPISFKQTGIATGPLLAVLEEIC